jgi:hypothetical protein
VRQVEDEYKLERFAEESERQEDLGGLCLGIWRKVPRIMRAQSGRGGGTGSLAYVRYTRSVGQSSIRFLKNAPCPHRLRIG